MAHEIDTTVYEQGAAFYGSGKAAWHGLGTVVEGTLTSAEAIKTAGMDWKVSQAPVQFFNGNETVEVAGRVVNYRSDSGAPLGVVSEFYEPFQNSQCFEFFDSIVGEGFAAYESAGCLFDGRRVWILGHISKDLWVNEADRVNTYMLLSNGHDGGAALRMIPTTIRVVCNNTLRLAMHEADRNGQAGFTLTHFTKLSERVAFARKALGIVSQRVDQFAVDAERLLRSKPGVVARDQYLAKVSQEVTRTDAGQQKFIDRVMANLASPTNMVGRMEGSLWAAYNAVSEWADHQQRATGKYYVADRRMESVLYGRMDKVKQTAWKLALAATAS